MDILIFLEKLQAKIGGERMKVQVIMDVVDVKRIDSQAKKKGLSRSAYCAMLIVEAVARDESREKAFNEMLEREKK